MAFRPLLFRPEVTKHARRGKRFPAGVAALFLAVALTLPPGGMVEAASRPPVRGAGGAVASDERLATEVGLHVLGRGGNAADAAVATALALAVVEPEAGNLGGGGFATVKFGAEVAHLDFRETAPAAARRDLFLDERGEPIASASLVGPLAAGVPGSPAGLWELHRRYGRLPWAQVVEPARRLAARGFAVSSRLHHSLDEDKSDLVRFPETAAVWLREGEAPAAGTQIDLPDLAATLAAYAEEGPPAITAGPVAAAVVEVSGRYGGILTAADLAAYQPVWRPAVRFEACGWQVASASLPSSGGILLGATLAMLERLRWGEQERFGAGRVHLLAEALRRAFADRFLLGDPQTTRATAGELLDPAWLARRVASVDAERASPSSSVTRWDGGPPAESSDTTHLSVVDAEGNLVALTTTLNGAFGCALYVPGAGFFLNNQMDDFATAPGRPNLYGLVQGEANAVGAGKRMLSSQSPTIAWREGEAIALGGRGGGRIPTATLQVLLNLWLDADSLQAAIDRPRVHHQWLPDRLFVEPDALSPETRAELERRGHAIAITAAVAQVHAVRWLAGGEGGEVEAAADPRGGAGAAGVVRPQP
ncbi:MAG: gamma-glutamyltransferase [bacterium]|nr:gamma-glutamyltransferase [bacterium]